MATPPPDLNTAVFPGFSVDSIHLYFTLAKEGLISELVSPQSQELSLSPLLTSPLVKKAVKNVSLRAEGVEQPIQFILHIKGLKCGRLLLAQSICREDHTHSMLPNQ